MGAEAYQRLPAYREEADRCADAFTTAGLASPLSYLLTDSDQAWSQIQIQGAQFIQAVSLAQVWRSCGVLPDITVGHSLGEVAAAYVAGGLALPDAVAVVAARAAVVDQLPGRYSMAVLGMGVDEAQRFIAETSGWLEISAVNAPSSIVVSGDDDAVAAIVRLAERRGIFGRAIAVDYPGHTSALAPLRSTFEELLPRSGFLDTPVEFVSSSYGTVVGADTDFTNYWSRNLVNTVRFDDAVRVAVQRGANAFVELSAHPSLLSALAELIDAEPTVIVGSGRRNECLVDELSANIAAVAVSDPRYRWGDVVHAGPHQMLWGFPNAPMRAMHLWVTPEPGSTLTVAFEEWALRKETRQSSRDRPSCRIAIVSSAGSDDALAQRLTKTIAAHRECEVTGPDEAEIAVVIAPPVLHADVTIAAREIGSHLATGQFDYHRAIGPRCRRVWLVTAGGERVSPDEAVALPAQAALGAMHRSIGFEFPDRAFAHLDLPSREIDGEAARACIDVLLDDDNEVALRKDGASGLRRYVRKLSEPRTPAPERPLDVAALENVVITGGSGRIGLCYARHCVERGARRVILLSRKGVDAAELDRLVDGLSAEVHAPTCDITDSGALSAIAADYAGDGASLLIHAAGAARFGPHDRLTDADLDDVFAAKVIGLVRMTETWPLRADARIVLCSSISGVWGGRGHAAYGAANRMLDVLADRLRAQGLDCLAVRWGLWKGSGIAGADDIARVERSGLVAMDPAAAISASLRVYDADPLIFDADLDRLRVFFESQGTPVPFGAAAPPEPDVPADGSDDRSVDELVRGELASVLSLADPASVDLSRALVDLGVDSLLAIDLRKRLRRGTGHLVPLARLLGGITGTELIDALESASGTESPTTRGKRERLDLSRD
jgi:mycobactin polyketide synthetase MbtD